MAGMFAIILTLATFFTGILWFLEKFKWKPARQRKVEDVRKQTDGKIDGKILAEVGSPKKWVDSLASFFPVLFVVFVIRSFIVEPFQIPSGSMMPTLLVGDFIAVQKYAYGIKDPITNATVIPTGHPKRGDIAVFKNPLNTSIDFVKRVVGVPGDKIVYQPDTKELFIYPACETQDTMCKGQQSQPLNLKYTDVTPSEWVEVLSQAGTNFYTEQQYSGLNLPKNNSQLAFSLNKRNETLGEQTHDILLLPMQIHDLNDFYKQSGQKLGEWIVPHGYYFMMGDNRDNSDDSRFWGFVPEKNFVGKVSAIWMSFEKQPNEWPSSIRFNRIGSVH
ncbi:signal peptidase I [Orbus hercynius]|uniref:Signal peptidase I n=1 Tax=Orbus hercynius TaxID=593135 RepID=A0A495RM09_9GAMM|nr:signal peptidase I [Orbus hercynius]RKS87838.1 signal peptidase I [Orbus hercynius]